MSNIVKDADGTYRWAFEFNLYHNPTVLFTVMKILLGILVVGVVVLVISDLGQPWFWQDPVGALSENLLFGGKFALFFIVLIVVGYLVYAAMQGGKYCVLFEMNDEGITHRQFDKQVKKAQVVGLINVLMGLASGNATQVGIGLTSARSSLSSDFSAVRSIKGSRMLGVIKVNEPLAKNQVYVEREDYDFVFDYIRERCPNAKVKG